MSAEIGHTRGAHLVEHGAIDTSHGPVLYVENLTVAFDGFKALDDLTTIGLTAEVSRPAGVLSHDQKQWLEIGMLLVQNPRLLLVDEPVAGMTQQEVERTAKLLNDLAGARTVVVVENDMEFVRSIARKATVLHQGTVISEASMDEVQDDPRVVEVYLGS